MKLEDFLQVQWMGNTARDYLIALFAFLGLFLVFRLFAHVVVGRLKRFAGATKFDFDDELIKAISAISGVFYLVLALYFSIKGLELTDYFRQWSNGIFFVVFVYEAIQFFQAAIEYALFKIVKKRGGTKEDTDGAFYGLKLLVKIVLWCMGLLLILSNLGVNVTSLVASLGVGGIAVALAVQNILGDIFSSFSIYFDKPFKVGDFIVVGDQKGTVKKIGLKTTRLQALQGEELVISNKELTSSRVQNFKKLEKRRVAITFGVTYDTSTAKLKKIPQFVEKIAAGIDLLEFDRAHFMEFGESSLDFELVYFVNSNDYKIYMDKRQEINLAIKEKFEKEKIDFAFPTQMVHLKK